MKIINALPILVFILCCKKPKETCKDYSDIKKGFDIYEYVLDTLLTTDTSFANQDIFFKANELYPEIVWSIGSDPRSFNTQTIKLRFLNPESFNITLSANFKDQDCNIQRFTLIKPFVLLDDDGSIESPLVGSYKGYNTDEPNDKFTVTIKLWKGLRYNWWDAGAYSVENLPRGYCDTTQNFNGYSRPEIKGIVATTKYKNIAIDRGGNIPALGIKGYGRLLRGINDTLIFDYSIIDTAYLNSTGKTNYILKKFIGIKN
jgi:hypothetical protein